jgi:hypothetical protein
MKTAFIAFLFLALPFAHADEKPKASPEAASASELPEDYGHTPYRSNSQSHIWLGADVGGNFSPAIAGYATGIGGGAQLGANVRVRLGRCGVMFSYRNESDAYADPAYTHNMLGGAGVFCRVVNVMSARKFWHGTFVDAHALYEYGRSDYHWTANTNYDAYDGHANSTAETIGGDLYFPLWFGFWARAGTDIEIQNFKYKAIRATTGEMQSKSGTTLFLFHVGLSYAFL